MKLQFTNGYRPRFNQISRIVQYLSSHWGQQRFLRQELIENLGISDKQIENLISMMTGFGLVNPRVNTLTEFGRIISLNDPYFERIETLWIIHYIVSSNPNWVVWYRIINEIIPLQDEYTVQTISQNSFMDLANLYSERTYNSKLPKEVSAVFASYTRSELSNLNILGEAKTGTFYRSDPVDIPLLAFLFLIIYYRDDYSPGSSALNIPDICSAENSPGKVLNLPEYRVRTLVESLHESGMIRVEKLANLDQIRFLDTTTQSSILERIYEGM